MELDVQTHFSQGWSPTLLDKLAGLGVTEVRDSQPWSGVETSVGAYNFTPALTNYMAKAASLNIGTLLTFASANALYDSGYTPYTQAGRDAYANYIVAVLQKYGGTVKEVEIWNEFNTGNFTGPAATDAAASYTALLKTVYEKVKPLFPNVEILGGSTNSIGTGALESLFKLGALSYMDGVVVHPYRSTPEHVDDELTHLNDVMAKYGAVKPIYATEFGNEFANAADVPDFMLKMVTLMASAHVAEASWYSAMDESYHQNMGLFARDGTAKPAAASFGFIEKTLIPLGDPVKIDTGSDMTLVYKFGADTYVMWSSGRDVKFDAGGTFYNSKGEVIAAPTSLSMTPIVYKGPGFTLGDSKVVADTTMQFGEGDWQYFAKTPSGALTPLTNVDGNWTSYLGSQYTKPLRINADSLAPAGDGKNPVQVMERYTSSQTQKVAINGSWTTGPGDGVDFHILVNGKEIYTKIFQGTFTLTDYQVALKQGDTLDFAIGPNQLYGGDSTSQALTLTRVDGTAGMTAVHLGNAAPKPAMTEMQGTAGNDILNGTSGADHISGGAGNDQIKGLAGDDLLQGGLGQNTIDGGDGFDTVSYADATAGVNVKLGYNGFQSISSGITDKLLNIEGVIGSAFNDTFSGSAADESFSGGAGNDLFMASGGSDKIDGGDGSDTLTFQNWTSGVNVSLQTTAIQAIDATNHLQVASIETLIGTNYADVLTAGQAGSELQGGSGNDLLIGGAGNDILNGGRDIDTASYALATAGVTVSLAVTTPQNTVGAGTDTLIGIENLTGSALNDRLTGSSTANVINGGAGDDVIIGGGGADTLTGGSGADRFTYLAASDSKPGAYDTITDFSAAQGDKIDMSAIDANMMLSGHQAFSLVDHFARHPGELTIAVESGGWLVQADINGDGVADFGLHIQSAAAPKLTDFVF